MLPVHPEGVAGRRALVEADAIPAAGTTALAQIPSSERDAADRLSAYLAEPTVAHTAAQAIENAIQSANKGSIEYRYRDSNPGFRRERAAS
jgi:hypothetical protein